MPLAAASAAPIIPSASAAPTAPQRLSIEEQVEELSLYSESDDAVGNGDIWYVPESPELFGTDGFTFRDFLDIINPLQHIPVVSTVYRAVTGDTLDPGARLLGGALFGGIGGLATAVVNAVVEDETGTDIGGNILAALTGNSGGHKTVSTAVSPETTPEAAGTALLLAAAIPKGAPAGPASESPSARPPLSGTPPPAVAPISLLPRTAPFAPAPGGAASKYIGAAPPDAVPRLMMDALEKYEALSRARRGQATAEEI